MIRNFCFTINNYTDTDKEQINALGAVYCVYGHEKGESNTPHLQGYAELKNPTRVTTLRKRLPRAHIEGRKGTQEEAIKYCKKDGDIVEFGTPKKQGCRNDLDVVRQTALEGGMREVTATFNYQQMKVAEKFLTYNEEPRDWKPKIVYIHGPSGSGKSKMAREMCGEDVYTKNDDSKWWDGYDAHTDVIIDDIRGSWWKITYFLALIDRYEFRVEVKGGFRQMKAKRMIITSILPPDQLYTLKGEPQEQILRRIDQVIDLNSVTDVTEVGG